MCNDNILHGVKWGDLLERTKDDLLERAQYVNAVTGDIVKTGECLVDLTDELTVEGVVTDNGEETVLQIKDNAIIYNPMIGMLKLSRKLKVDLYDVYTAQEAAEKWGVTEAAIRKAISSKRFIYGVDYRKAGRITLVSKEAMERLYGEL